MRIAALLRPARARARAACPPTRFLQQALHRLARTSALKREAHAPPRVRARHRARDRARERRPRRHHRRPHEPRARAGVRGACARSSRSELGLDPTRRQRRPRQPRPLHARRAARAALHAVLRTSTSTSDFRSSPSTSALGRFPYREAPRPVRDHRPLERGAAPAARRRGRARATRSSTRSSRILAHPEVKKRTPVILAPSPHPQPAVEGEDAHRGPRRRGRSLRRAARRRRAASSSTATSTSASSAASRRDAGELARAVGATSASLHHDDEHRMAGFNVYEFDDAASRPIEAHVSTRRDVARCREASGRRLRRTGQPVREVGLGLALVTEGLSL